MLKNLKYVISYILKAQKNNQLMYKLSIRNKKDLVSFLNILQEENLILNYIFYPDRCYVYFKSSTIKSFKFYGYPTKPVFVKRKILYQKYKVNKGSVLIISTNLGLINLKFAAFYGIGGLLVCKIN